MGWGGWWVKQLNKVRVNLLRKYLFVFCIDREREREGSDQVSYFLRIKTKMASFFSLLSNTLICMEKTTAQISCLQKVITNK